MAARGVEHHGTDNGARGKTRGEARAQSARPVAIVFIFFLDKFPRVSVQIVEQSLFSVEYFPTSLSLPNFLGKCFPSILQLFPKGFGPRETGRFQW